MESLYYDMELPLTYILCDMEDTGIYCDKDVLSEISQNMMEQMNVLQKILLKLLVKHLI